MIVLYQYQYVPSHIHTRTTKQTACHTRVRVVSIQQTHGTAVPWVGQTKSPSCCAHTRLKWNVGSVHMWNVLFQAPFAQSVEVYTTLMEYYWTILPRCKFGNTPFNTCTKDRGQRWWVSNLLLEFFKPSNSYFELRPWVDLVSVLRLPFKYKWNDIQGQMSVVSSNMVMSEGNPRVAGGRVLLPLVAEPVGVFVPFSRTQIQTREKVEKKSRLEFKLNLETQLFSVLKRPDTLFQEFQ